MVSTIISMRVNQSIVSLALNYISTYFQYSKLYFYVFSIFQHTHTRARSHTRTHTHARTQFYYYYFFYQSSPSYIPYLSQSDPYYPSSLSGQKQHGRLCFHFSFISHGHLGRLEGVYYRDLSCSGSVRPGFNLSFTTS